MPTILGGIKQRMQMLWVIVRVLPYNSAWSLDWCPIITPNGLYFFFKTCHTSWDIHIESSKTDTPWKINIWNPKSWRLGSDEFPFPSGLIFRFHVNFPGCSWNIHRWLFFSPWPKAPQRPRYEARLPQLIEARDKWLKVGAGCFQRQPVKLRRKQRHQ